MHLYQHLCLKAAEAEYQKAARNLDIKELVVTLNFILPATINFDVPSDNTPYEALNRLKQLADNESPLIQQFDINDFSLSIPGDPYNTPVLMLSTLQGRVEHTNSLWFVMRWSGCYCLAPAHFTVEL